MHIKTLEQLEWKTMRRVRDRMVQRRTALINKIRGFLLERGITFPVNSPAEEPSAVIEDAELNLKHFASTILGDSCSRLDCKQQSRLRPAYQLGLPSPAICVAAKVNAVDPY